LQELLTIEGAWWQVFGRTHLVALHFPIALLLVGALLEAMRLHLARGRGSPRTSPAGVTCVVLGGLAALLAAGSGWVYADLEFAAGGRLDWHRWAGVGTAGAAVVALVLGLLSRAGWGDRFAWPYRTFLLLAAVGVAVTGHLGGELVHGEGHLLAPLRSTSDSPGASELTPEEEEAEAPPAPGVGRDSHPDAGSVAEKGAQGREAVRDVRSVGFDPDVREILEASCMRCHNEERRRGDVALHTEEAVREYVIPGLPEMSQLVYVLELPESDERSMPKDRPSLPAEQIKVIRAWVEGLGGEEDGGTP